MAAEEIVQLPFDFSQPDECRQFGLEVEDRVFWVPKDGLCTYSQVFKKMLYGQFAEAKKNTVALPEKKAQDIQELLLCLFPTPVVKKVDNENVDLLLDFADEYEIEDLKSRCCDFLQQKIDKMIIADEKLLDILVLASKHRLRPILFRVVERCARSFDLEKFQPIFPQLASEVLGAIAWYKCQQTTPLKAAFHRRWSSRMCSTCEIGHTQNRCWTCGGVQRCVLCNHFPRAPRRARRCNCAEEHTVYNSPTEEISFNWGAAADALENEGADKGKDFDGAKALLERL